MRDYDHCLRTGIDKLQGGPSEAFLMLLPVIPGWEAVADFALDWALKHATS
jgi:hypothetical protein